MDTVENSEQHLNNLPILEEGHVEIIPNVEEPDSSCEVDYEALAELIYMIAESIFDGDNEEHWKALHSSTQNDELISQLDASEDEELFAREALNISQEDDPFKDLEAGLEELEDSTLPDKTSDNSTLSLDTEHAAGAFHDTTADTDIQEDDSFKDLEEGLEELEDRTLPDKTSDNSCIEHAGLEELEDGTLPDQTSDNSNPSLNTEHAAGDTEIHDTSADTDIQEDDCFKDLEELLELEDMTLLDKTLDNSCIEHAADAFHDTSGYYDTHRLGEVYLYYFSQELTDLL